MILCTNNGTEKTNGLFTVHFLGSIRHPHGLLVVSLIFQILLLLLNAAQMISLQERPSCLKNEELLD